MSNVNKNFKKKEIIYNAEKLSFVILYMKHVRFGKVFNVKAGYRSFCFSSNLQTTFLFADIDNILQSLLLLLLFILGNLLIRPDLQN